VADEAGKFKMIFPVGATGEEAAKVEKDRRYLLPPEDAYIFPAAPGDRKALILFSPATTGISREIGVRFAGNESAHWCWRAKLS